MRARIVRALALAASLPMAALGQTLGEKCEPTPPVRFSGLTFAIPMAVQPWRDSLLVLGHPALRLVRLRPDSFAIADSSLAGALWSLDGHARDIPRPPGALGFSYPRALVRADGEIDVLWSERDAPSVVGRSPDARTLYAARLGNSGWARISRVGRAATAMDISRTFGSDLVRVGAVPYLAFPERAPPERGHSTLVRVAFDSGDGWRWSAHDLGFLEISAVELSAFRGELVLLVAGIPRRESEPGTLRRPSLWLARLERGAFSTPVSLGVGEQGGTDTPLLLQYGRQLIAAWVNRAEPSALEWRDVTDTARLGPLQRLEGVVDVVQGQAPVRHLLLAQQTDGSVSLLTLRDDGHSSLPFRAPIIRLPPITGRIDAPFVLNVELIADGTSVEYVRHDLRCPLRR